MTFTEQKGDVFDFTDTHALVHCISADFSMSGGIAVPIARKFNLRPALQSIANKTIGQLLPFPSCQYVNGVLNLISKKYVYQKPTYPNLYSALVSMRKCIEDNDIEKIVMPYIGCGIDRLSWHLVRKLILTSMHDLDLKIVAVYL